MSFQRVEEYLNKTEAITRYPETKRDYFEARRSLEHARRELVEARRRVKHLEALKVSYDSGEYSLEEFNELVAGRTREWKEKELEKEAEKKADEMTPALVQGELDTMFESYPRKAPPRLVQHVEEEGKKVADQILGNRLSWPGWFKALYEAEVDKRVNQKQDKEFNDRVEQGASQRLNQRVLVEWPKFLNITATPFMQQGIQDLIMNLATDIAVTCPHCGHTTFENLSPEQLSIMIKGNFINIACKNQLCKGFLGSRRLTKLKLSDLLEQKVFQPAREKDVKVYRKRKEPG